MGKVIKKAGWKRSDPVIFTKIFWGGKGPNDCGLSRKHILEGVQIQTSLGRLQVGHVDPTFCHRSDWHTPVEETVRTMIHVIIQVWAFYWGMSGWSAEQIKDARPTARREHSILPQMEQPEYNMFNRECFEKEYTRLYTDFGLGPTIFSPLAGSLLTEPLMERINAIL